MVLYILFLQILFPTLKLYYQELFLQKGNLCETFLSAIHS